MNKNLSKDHSERKLKGSFWVMTTYFNSCNLKSKSVNYNFFRKKLSFQGIKLMTIECAFNGQKFSLQEGEDADILIQVRSNSIMWQKERLLNVGLQNLPADCDKLAWIDADIVFLDDKWGDKVCGLLEKYDIVKPFTEPLRLNKQETKRILGGGDWDFIKNKKVKPFYSSVNKNNLRYMAIFGTCARKEVIDKVGFYDKLIVSEGDMVMASVFLGEKYHNSNFPPILQADIDKWRRGFYANRQISIGYLRGRLFHLYHGSVINRQYHKKSKFLLDHDYNPYEDLFINKDGCFEWSSNKPKFHKSLKNYFINRNEDDKFFKKIILFFKNYPVSFFKELLFIFYYKLDALLGMLGIFLKKFFPRLYYFLKNK